jgi:hypothetical protein
MATRKVSSVLAASILVFFSLTYRAMAQETTTTTTKTTTTKDSKKADKGKAAEGQAAGKSDEAKGKGHEGQAKAKDKCGAAEFEKRDEGKKQGYICREADTCTKTCTLWRSRKDNSDAEWVANQGKWVEVTDQDRRNFKYYCVCEDAKKQ